MSRYQLFDVLQRALGPFSRFFHRMLTHGSEKPPRDIFPEHTSVEHWHSTLLYLGWLPRKAKSVRIRDESLVKQLYLCKSNKTKSLHEYVVAAIQTPDRTIVNVRIDRVRGEPRPAQGITDSDAVGPTNASYSSSRISVISRQSSQSSVPTKASSYLYSFSPESRRAEDSVRCNLDANPPAEVAQCLVFNTGREPKLMDLVFVVFAAHEYDNTYTIFGPQCYWYSKCIYEAVKALVGEGSYHEKTRHSPKLSRSASVASSTYFPGDVSQPAHQDQKANSPGTEVDPLLSRESWSPHRSGTNFKIPITRTPRKEVMSSIQSHYKTLKMNFDTEERDREQEFAAREADRQARIQAEERVVCLEEEARRYSEAIEALRAEVARLQAADV